MDEASSLTWVYTLNLPMYVTGPPLSYTQTITGAKLSLYQEMEKKVLMITGEKRQCSVSYFMFVN